MNWLVSLRCAAQRPNQGSLWAPYMIRWRKDTVPWFGLFGEVLLAVRPTTIWGNAKREEYQSLEINHELVGRTASNTASKASLHSLAERPNQGSLGAPELNSVVMTNYPKCERQLNCQLSTIETRGIASLRHRALHKDRTRGAWGLLI